VKFKSPSSAQYWLKRVERLQLALVRWVRPMIALTGFVCGMWVILAWSSAQGILDQFIPPKVQQQFGLKKLTEHTHAAAFVITGKVQYTLLRNNVERLQLMAEQYAADNQGSYPSSADVLYKTASQHGYWRTLRNPFTRATKDLTQIMLDYSYYNQERWRSKDFAGAVLYEALGGQGYRIYACDENGELLKRDNGTVLVIGNKL